MTADVYDVLSDTALDRVRARLAASAVLFQRQADDSRLALSLVAAVLEQRAGGLNILNPTPESQPTELI